MSDGKASFKCEIAVLNEFRRLVATKYGRLYGVLHKEFTEALKDRIDFLKEELKQNKTD